MPAGIAAHDRRRGARVRPVAQEHLRLRRAAPPAARARVAPRAARHRRPSCRPSTPLAAAIGHRSNRHPARSSCRSCCGLADEVDTRSIRSVIFTPPYYQVECLSTARRAATSSSPGSSGSGPPWRTRSTSTRASPSARRARRGGRRRCGSSTAPAGPARRRALSEYLELPRAGRLRAEPEAGLRGPVRDDDPRLQRRRGRSSRSRSRRSSRSSASPSCRSRTRRPGRLRGHHRHHRRPQLSPPPAP